MPDFEEKDILNFMNNHGMQEEGDFYNYHIALGYYYAYSVDAFRFAEMIETGEVFDEYEAAATMKSLYVAHKTLRYFQSQQGMNLYIFDVSESVIMGDSSLEKGQIKGDIKSAIRTARQWLSQFQKRNRDKAYKGFSEREEVVLKDFFLYEVAIYILYIAGEVVDYSFLSNLK